MPEGRTNMHDLNNRGYEMVSLIGKGATSLVYCVKNVKTGKNYACKISKESEYAKQESELMKVLAHPLFPRWKEFFITEEEGCLIMEYISGINMEALLSERKHLTQKETVRIGIELAEGLEYLHNRNPQLVFRDLKPLNMILQENGTVRLLDLGAVCPAGRSFPDSTRSGRYPIAGSAGYAAPEQMENGAESQIGWDIYALGKVLYYMISGRNPGIEYGTKSMQLGRQNVSMGIRLLIQDCMDRTGEKQPVNMREVIDRLMEYDNVNGFHYFMAELETVKHSFMAKRIRIEKNIRKSDYNTIDFPL